MLARLAKPPSRAISLTSMAEIVTPCEQVRKNFLGTISDPLLYPEGMGLVELLADAITKFEGGGPADLNMRNNNPGNLRTWGSYPVVNGYVKFPDMATGRAALEKQIQLNIRRGLSLSEFFAGKPGVYGGYAPAADANNPNNYANTVAAWLGISPTIALNSPGLTASLDFPAAVTPSGEGDGPVVAAVAGTLPAALLVALGLGGAALAYILLRG